jgi:cell wall-associated NlpC family hydrolase
MRGRGAIVAAAGALIAVLTSCGPAMKPAVRARTAAPPLQANRQVTGVPGTSPLTSPVTLPPEPAQAPTASAGAPPLWQSFHPLASDGGAFPRPAWVAVAVLTVWLQPGFVRPVDAPVLQPDPQVGKWVASMTTAQKVDLGQRMQTQALLDDPLTVLGLQGDWAHVLVDQQTGSVYADGIEGWVPRSQITFSPLHPTEVTATVTVPFARAGDVVLSYGTRLPVAGTSGANLEVATPQGVLDVPKTDVSTAPLNAGGAAVLREAERFLGLPYLWAGTSAYGFDCSGLSYAVYRQFGVTLARDAGDQAQQGTPVAKQDLQPGDLVFFESGGFVHHVAFYAGSGMMLDAPQTGGRVEVVPLWTSYLATQYAGARRYLNT